MTDLEYIVSKLSKEEILCQIAEEASELAQAAPFPSLVAIMKKGKNND